MSHTVGDCDKRQIRSTDIELALLFRRLDVAKCIERADMLPADWWRSFQIVGGNFRLPDESVDVASQAEGRKLVGREQRIKQPLIATCINLKQ